MKTKLTPEQKYAKLALKTASLLRASADGLLDLAIADNLAGRLTRGDDGRHILARSCSEVAGFLFNKYGRVAA